MEFLGNPMHRLIERFRDPPPVVSVLRLSGIIGRLGPWKRGLSLAGQAALIERAFKARRLGAVALSVNSPGGSPVQAALIAKRIRVLADEKGVPVFAFAEDVAASGGYWLALAADEIYADENSIIGSIGVISAGFGFSRSSGALRDRAPPARGGPQEGNARPLPGRKGRRRKKAERPPGGHSQRASCTRSASAGRAS